MFSHRNSSGFCCFAMKRPLQKLKGNVLCVFEKPQRGCKGWWFNASLCRILTSVLGSLQYNEAGRMHIGWVCCCSQITCCREVGNVGAIPVFSAHNSRVLWHDILRRDPPRKFNGRVRRCWKKLIYYYYENMSHINGGRLCEIYESGCAWFREWYMRWRQTTGNVSVIMGKVLKKELRKT